MICIGWAWSRTDQVTCRDLRIGRIFRAPPCNVCCRDLSSRPERGEENRSEFSTGADQLMQIKPEIGYEIRKPKCGRGSRDLRRRSFPAINESNLNLFLQLGEHLVDMRSILALNEGAPFLLKEVICKSVGCTFIQRKRREMHEQARRGPSA